jgi:hypothetical protein
MNGTKGSGARNAVRRVSPACLKRTNPTYQPFTACRMALRLLPPIMAPTSNARRATSRRCHRPPQVGGFSCIMARKLLTEDRHDYRTHRLDRPFHHRGMADPGWKMDRSKPILTVDDNRHAYNRGSRNYCGVHSYIAPLRYYRPSRRSSDAAQPLDRSHRCLHPRGDAECQR